MSLTDVLVLPPDVHVIPVADLPEAIRERLGDEAGRYAVTHPHARSPSTVVDDGFAELLREFESPSSVVDAVLRYSTRRTLEPETVLEDAYPALRRCVSQGYLVDAESPRALVHRNCFAAGERVAGGVVLRCVQTLEDTEIYQLARDDGTLLALKVLRPGSSPVATETFARESRTLGELGGRVAPRLVETGTTGGLSWHSMEWCEGVHVSTAAAALRATGGRGARERLLGLCLRLVEAYADLHALGFVHGDTHPGNAIAAPDGTIRLVDFGLARRTGGATEDLTRRAGAPGFLAPDHAAALLEGRAPAQASERTEVYSLGAVLYQMLTGMTYVDFSIEDEGMLRQIVEDGPLPFTRRGLAGWPGVESALHRALAKDEADRPSAAELARLLASARETPVDGQGPGHGVENLLETVLAAARPGGTWFEEGTPTAPMCSIAYGTAGLVMTLHHVALLRDDADLLALADEWAARAMDGADDPDAFRNTRLDVTEEVTGLVSPFHRVSGVHAAQALVSHALRDPGPRLRAVDGFVRESGHDCAKFDLTLGRTGTLLGAALLVEALGDDPFVDLGAVVDLGNNTCADLWAWLATLRPVAEADELRTLGMAHGWAGQLLATLRWSRAVAAAPPAETTERLEQLASLAQVDGRALSWPWSTAGPYTMRGWCNGSAGMVHLWTSAHQVFGDEQWLRLAEGAAWHAAEATGAVPQLCCGVAGQAHAQLAMYRHTGERHWLTLARELTTVAVHGLEAGPGTACVSGSLHKGDVGIAALAADLERPEEASMPFFGPAG